MKIVKTAHGQIQEFLMLLRNTEQVAQT